MRLVGASNFSIQMPFILETVLATFVGGILAIGSALGLRALLRRGRAVARDPVTNFIGVSAVLTTAPWLLLGGVVLAGLVSAVTCASTCGCRAPAAPAEPRAACLPVLPCDTW